MTARSLTSNTRLVNSLGVFCWRKTEAHRARVKGSIFPLAQFTPSSDDDTPLEPLQVFTPSIAWTARFPSCRFPPSSLRTAAVGSLSPFGRTSLARRQGFRSATDLLFAESKSRQKGVFKIMEVVELDRRYKHVIEYCSVEFEKEFRY